MDGSTIQLTKHDFLNPRYVRSYEDEKHVLEDRAQNLGYMALALVATARMAFENESSGVPMENRGIGQTLEVTEAIIGDLIAEIECGRRNRPAASSDE